MATPAPSRPGARPAAPAAALPLTGSFTRPGLFWAVVLTLLGAWFLTLDMRHLLRSDEGRYAEIAREMFASGDWVTIRYNDLKYFEKPPFHLWMTAAVYSLFGVGDWQARLWVACSGAIGIGMTALAAQRWWGPRAGLLAGLALLAAPTWNIGSHFNALDMGVSGALAGVLCCLLIAQHPQTSAPSQSRWMWAAWASMAVAVLTKGLIGIVLPGLALVAYTLAARDWALWQRLRLVTGSLLFLLITAPWFVLVSQRNPEFVQFFFIHEHWQRYTSTVHSRSAPAWYFVPQLLAGFLPWLGLTPRIVKAVRLESRGGFRPQLFCAAWATAIFVFFSASGSKLPGYVLPMFPALALLAAAALANLDQKAWGRQVLGGMLLAGAALLASTWIGQGDGHGAGQADVRRYGHWISAGCALALVGLGAAWWLNKRRGGDGTPLPSITAYALAVFSATTLGLLGHQTMGRPASGADLVPAIQQVLTPEMTLYSVRLLDHTLPFYLRRTTVMVEEPDELEFGTQQEPQKWLPTVALFKAAWTSGPPAMAVMTPSQFTQLQAEDLPMTRVAHDARRVVVANFAVPASR
jgi:4-amino-4-deoxy-L-arabinose transferase-like glycosyltransferase